MQEIQLNRKRNKNRNLASSTATTTDVVATTAEPTIEREREVLFDRLELNSRVFDSPLREATLLL